MPAIAFFGGFLWDALTIGRQINPSDLWFLAAYLLAAGLILYWMGHKSHAHGLMTEAQDRKSTRLNSSHSQQSRMPSSA